MIKWHFFQNPKNLILSASDSSSFFSKKEPYQILIIHDSFIVYIQKIRKNLSHFLDLALQIDRWMSGQRNWAKFVRQNLPAKIFFWSSLYICNVKLFPCLNTHLLFLLSLFLTFLLIRWICMTGNYATFFYFHSCFVQNERSWC